MRKYAYIYIHLYIYIYIRIYLEQCIIASPSTPQKSHHCVSISSCASLISLSPPQSSSLPSPPPPSSLRTGPLPALRSSCFRDLFAFSIPPPPSLHSSAATGEELFFEPLRSGSWSSNVNLSDTCMMRD